MVFSICSYPEHDCVFFRLSIADKTLCGLVAAFLVLALNSEKDVFRRMAVSGCVYDCMMPLRTA